VAVSIFFHFFVKTENIHFSFLPSFID